RTCPPASRWPAGGGSCAVLRHVGGLWHGTTNSATRWPVCQASPRQRRRRSIRIRLTILPPSDGPGRAHAPDHDGAVSGARSDALGDLDGVEGGALAEVVAGDEERQALPVGDRLVGADAPDEDV